MGGNVFAAEHDGELHGDVSPRSAHVLDLLLRWCTFRALYRVRFGLHTWRTHVASCVRYNEPVTYGKLTPFFPKRSDPLTEITLAEAI